MSCTQQGSVYNPDTSNESPSVNNLQKSREKGGAGGWSLCSEDATGFYISASSTEEEDNSVHFLPSLEDPVRSMMTYTFPSGSRSI